jgi:hypothetical protein
LHDRFVAAANSKEDSVGLSRQVGPDGELSRPITTAPVEQISTAPEAISLAVWTETWNSETWNSGENDIAQKLECGVGGFRHPYEHDGDSDPSFIGTAQAEPPPGQRHRRRDGEMDPGIVLRAA